MRARLAALASLLAVGCACRPASAPTLARVHYDAGRPVAVELVVGGESKATYQLPTESGR